MEDWYRINLFRLVELAKVSASKYTRSKVRKALPKEFAYIIEELLHENNSSADKDRYYTEIIHTIIDLGQADRFITAMCKLIQRLAIDQLHVLGDIYDRGPHAARIMDILANYHSVDIQWGNHDIVWMGAAAGSWACTANILRINISYNNFDMLEIGYGINLRPLTSFANKIYADDECRAFWPKGIDKNEFDPVSEATAAKMHKAIAVIQFKIEGQRILENPEFELDHRRLLHMFRFR